MAQIYKINVILIFKFIGSTYYSIITYPAMHPNLVRMADADYILVRMANAAFCAARRVLAWHRPISKPSCFWHFGASRSLNRLPPALLLRATGHSLIQHPPEDRRAFSQPD